MSSANVDMQLPHLCAGAKEVAYIYRVYAGLASAFGINFKDDIAEPLKFDLIYVEALGMNERYDCMTYVDN